PAIVGQTLMLNGRPLTVTGVAPPEFTGLGVAAPDVWVPVGMSSLVRPMEGLQLAIGARLKDGITRASGQRGDRDARPRTRTRASEVAYRLSVACRCGVSDSAESSARCGRIPGALDGSDGPGPRDRVRERGQRLTGSCRRAPARDRRARRDRRGAR